MPVKHKKSDGEPLIDPEVMQTLRSLEKSVPAVFNETKQTFFKNSKLIVMEMREAISEDDDNALLTCLHKLRGGSGVLGGRRLSILCAEIEKMVPLAPDNKAKVIDEVETELKCFCRYLREM